MLSAEERVQIDAQMALSKNLSLGVVLSLLPVAGLGSAAAIWIGVRAWKKIGASEQKLVGTGMAVWCVAAGVIGLIANVVFFWPMVSNPPR
jgi:hypothetical protein